MLYSLSGFSEAASIRAGPNMLDLDRIQAFAVFGELLSFTHAAKRLGLSQPALHTKIKKLEQDIGTQLYRRSGRALELTPHGIETLRFSQAIRQQSQSFVEQIAGRQSAEPARLSAGEGSLLYLLGSAIQRHQRAGHEIKISTHNREQTLEALLHGSADLGVTQIDGPAPEQLTQMRILRVPQQLILPSGHWLATKRALRLEQLAGERWVLPPANRPHRQQLERALASVGVHPEVAVEASGWPLMLNCVRLGLGICVANGIVPVGRGLVARPLRGLPSLNYALLYRAEVLKRENIASLRDAIVSEVAQR